MTVKEIAAELYAAWITASEVYHAQHVAQYSTTRVTFRERWEAAIARLMPQRRAVKDRDGDTWEQNGGGKWQIARHREEWFGHEADWFEKTYVPLRCIDPPAEAKPTAAAPQWDTTATPTNRLIEIIHQRLSDGAVEWLKRGSFDKVREYCEAMDCLSGLIKHAAIEDSDIPF